MRNLKNEINKILEVNKLEYFKLDGEYWIISEVQKGECFDDKFRYCTNTRTKRNLLTFLETKDLKELYYYIN